MGSMCLIFVMASLGLPGLGNFIAEILILIGAFYGPFKILTIIATIVMILATAYSLRIMQKVFYVKEHQQWKFSDLNVSEMLVFILLEQDSTCLNYYQMV